MENGKIRFSIIILSWNTKGLLRQCLKSVISDQLSVFSKENKLVTNHWSLTTEVIVVDNGSTDGSPQMVKKEFPKVKLIENKENLGFAKGNNVGIKSAKGEYVMLLNSDTIVKEEALEKMLKFLDNHQEISIIGPKLLNKDGTLQANCGRFPTLSVALAMLFKEHFGGSDYVRLSPRESGPVDWLVGAAFIARKKVFEKIGGFDEEIFMYMEEVEWFYRAKLAGFNAYFLKDAEIIHLGRGSSKSGKSEPILNIYKGIIHFYRKHRSLPELLILEFLLKTKALFALALGLLKKDQYLIKTYGQALKIS